MAMYECNFCKILFPTTEGVRRHQATAHQHFAPPSTQYNIVRDSSYTTTSVSSTVFVDSVGGSGGTCDSGSFDSGCSE